MDAHSADVKPLGSFLVGDPGAFLAGERRLEALRVGPGALDVVDIFNQLSRAAPAKAARLKSARKVEFARKDDG